MRVDLLEDRDIKAALLRGRKMGNALQSLEFLHWLDFSDIYLQHDTINLLNI
jgi:hypothetical protein